MKLKDVYRYTGALYAANLFASGITFLVMIWLSREISKEALGAYGLFQAYFMLGAYATGLGVNQTLVKYVAERQVPLAEIHSFLATLIAGMSVLFIAAGAALIHFGQELLGLAVLMLPAYHIFDFSLSYVRGHWWKRAEAGILLASSLMTSIFILVLTPSFSDFHGPIYGQIASFYTLAAVLLAVFLYRLRGEARFAAIRGNWLRAFSLTAAPLFVTSALYSLSEVVDRFIIEHFLGLAVLAEYFIAMAFFQILDKPSGLLARVLLSYFSGTTATKDAGLHMHNVQRLIQFNTLLFPLFSLAVIAILPPVLAQFFNKDYSQAFDLFAIVSVVMVIKAFEVVNSMLAIAKDSPRTNMYSQIVSLAIYIPGAIVLLKTFGVIGVAAGIVVRWIIFSLYQFWHMKGSAVATVSASMFWRALLAYCAALAFFPYATWAMIPVYLAVGMALRLWEPRELWRQVAGLRQGLSRA